MRSGRDSDESVTESDCGSPEDVSGEALSFEKTVELAVREETTLLAVEVGLRFLVSSKLTHCSVVSECTLESSSSTLATSSGRSTPR